MTKLAENAIEDFAIKLFEQLGYSHVYAPDIAPDGESPERSHYDEVILKDRLWSAVQRINSSVPHYALQEAAKDVERIHSPELLANNVCVLYSGRQQ
jgi:type I restriction enzyme, R subunit